MCLTENSWDSSLLKLKVLLTPKVVAIYINKHIMIFEVKKFGNIFDYDI